MESIIEKIVTEVEETEENFIFTTISPFCNQFTERRLSKEDLKRMIMRQTPMKPHRTSNSYFSSMCLTSNPPKYYWDCPSCNIMIGFDRESLYCPKCGQKINWEV